MSGEPPPDKPSTRLPWWEIAILAGIGVALAFVAITAILGERHDSASARRRLECINHLDRLGRAFAADADPERLRLDGPARFLAYRKSGDLIRRGDERVLLCPEDDDARIPEADAERRAWDDADLAHPSRALCSYAVRDFSKREWSGEPGRCPIAACLHHERAAIVLFDDGDVQVLRLADLGIESDDEKLVGPASKSKPLSDLTYGDGRVQ